MNKNNIVIVGVAVGVIGIGYYALTSSAPTSDIVAESGENLPPAIRQNQDIELASTSQQTESDAAMMAKEDVMVEESAPSPTPQTDAVKPAEVVATAGTFEAYQADKLALAATGDVVIFFHASWCPSCRALSSDIENNRLAIPAGTTILKADYDTETELKRKYGVTTQHTLVQVDQDGNLIKKWSGGSKLENLLSQIE